MAARDKFKFGEIDAVLSNVELSIGLPIHRIEIQGQDLEFITHPSEFKLAKPGLLTVTLLEADLAKFLNKKQPGGLKDFSVKVKGGLLNIEATATIIIPVKAKVSCGLTIKNHKQLWVDLKSVDVAGIGAKSLVQSQIDQVNPVFDIVDFPMEATMDTVSIEEGQVVITGTVSATE